MFLRPRPEMATVHAETAVLLVRDGRGERRCVEREGSWKKGVGGGDDRGGGEQWGKER